MRNIRYNILKREDSYDDDDSDGQNTQVGFSFEMLKSTLKIDSESSNSRSTSSLDDSEDDFQPEMFGLLDNPGVLRFGCLDYPLAVTEYSNDEDIADTAPDWIRVSYDDLTMGKDYVKDGDSDRKILSRSLDDIRNIYSDMEGRRI